MPGEQPAGTGRVVLVKKIIMKDEAAVGGGQPPFLRYFIKRSTARIIYIYISVISVVIYIAFYISFNFC